MNADFENGLTGVGWALMYLMEEGFVKGNPNSVLKEIDDKIFNVFYFEFLIKRNNRSIDDLIVMTHYSLYFCKRLNDPGLSKTERSLFQDTSVYV